MRSKYLGEFERHLLVGEPKRAEILTELQNHLSENGGQADQLGNPKRLALKYNRTHLGILDAVWKIAIVPVLYLLLLGIYKWWGIASFRNGWPSIDDRSTGFPLWAYLIIILPVVISIFLGRSISRYHRSDRLFRNVWVWSALLGAVLGVLIDEYTGRADIDVADTMLGIMSSGVIFAIITSTVSAAAGFVGVFLSSWSVTYIPIHRRRTHYFFQILFAVVGIGLLTSWSLSIFSPPYLAASWHMLLPFLGLIAYGLYYVGRKIVEIRGLMREPSGKINE